MTKIVFLLALTILCWSYAVAEDVVEPPTTTTSTASTTTALSSTTTTTAQTTTIPSPAYACENPPKTLIDCEQNKAKCTEKNWADVMSRLCPKTCGLCATSNCTDNLDCAGMELLCRDIDWNAFMKQQCAKTCGFCDTSGGGCTDRSSSCVQNARFCNNPTYRDFLTQNCPRTCNRCGGQGGGSGGVCADSSSSCNIWNSRGFCQSTFYDNNYKRRFCAQTCQLC